MQYIVIAHDSPAEGTLERRLASRPAHIELGDRMRAEGKLLFAVALLDEQERMVGSVMICDFRTRLELDQWLEIEPYVVGGVWDKVDVQMCKVGPSFHDLIPPPRARTRPE